MSEADDTDEELGPSKSERKREFKTYQSLGKRLIALPEHELTQVPLPEKLAEHVRLARRLTKGALQRELRFIGRLVSESDPQAIDNALAVIKHVHDLNTFAFRRVERWRDQLLADEAEVLDEILAEHPEADRQQIRQLARNARREREREQPPKSARALFRYLNGL